MRGAKALGVPIGQYTVQLYLRLATWCVQGFHTRPAHGAMQTQPDRFGEGFFGGKPRGQITDSPRRITRAATLENLQLARPQNALG